jgi:hypothetical protein
MLNCWGGHPSSNYLLSSWGRCGDEWEEQGFSRRRHQWADSLRGRGWARAGNAGAALAGLSSARRSRGSAIATREQPSSKVEPRVDINNGASLISQSPSCFIFKLINCTRRPSKKIQRPGFTVSTASFTDWGRRGPPGGLFTCIPIQASA